MKTTEAGAQFCRDFIEAVNSRKQQKSADAPNIGFLTRGAISSLNREAEALNRLCTYLDVVLMPTDRHQCLVTLSTLVTVIVDSYSRPVSADEIAGRLCLLRFTWSGSGRVGLWTRGECADFIRDYLLVERPVPMAGGRIKVLKPVGADHWAAVSQDSASPVSSKPATKKLARVTTGKRAAARRTRPMLG